MQPLYQTAVSFTIFGDYVSLTDENGQGPKRTDNDTGKSIAVPSNQITISIFQRPFVGGVVAESSVNRLAISLALQVKKPLMAADERR
jgi:hypothetical protein